MSGLSWADETENEELERFEMKSTVEPVISTPQTQPKQVEQEKEQPIVVEKQPLPQPPSVQDQQDESRENNRSSSGRDNNNNSGYNNNNYYNRPQQQQGGYQNNRYNNNNNQQQQGGYQNNRYNNNNNQQQQGGYQNNRYNNNNNQQQQQQGGYQNNRMQQQGGYQNNNQQQQGGYQNNRMQQQGGYQNNNYNNNQYGQKQHSANFRRNEVLITGYDESKASKEAFQDYLQGLLIEFSDITFSPKETIVALKDSENYQKAMRLSGTDFAESQINVVNYTRKPQGYNNQQNWQSNNNNNNNNSGENQQSSGSSYVPQPNPNRVNPFGNATPINVNVDGSKPVVSQQQGQQQQSQQPQQGQQPQQQQGQVQQQQQGQQNTDNKYRPNSMRTGFNKDNKFENKYDNKKSFGQNKYQNNKKEEDGWKSTGPVKQTKEQPKETTQPTVPKTNNIFSCLDDDDDDSDN